MNWNVALRLGRVSNLPTVWSNSLAGLVLAGGFLALDTDLAVPLILMAIMLDLSRKNAGYLSHLRC